MRGATVPRAGQQMKSKPGVFWEKPKRGGCATFKGAGLRVEIGTPSQFLVANLLLVCKMQLKIDTP